MKIKKGDFIKLHYRPFSFSPKVILTFEVMRTGRHYYLYNQAQGIDLRKSKKDIVEMLVE